MTIVTLESSGINMRFALSFKHWIFKLKQSLFIEAKVIPVVKLSIENFAIHMFHLLYLVISNISFLL